ncbi:MAG: PD-(D/E)XK nuclease family protein [Gemmatimonadetes bacterium]|nr:PD-(D/E)XK nuclease family protein [Gemmatimonadota bacterium]
MRALAAPDFDTLRACLAEEIANAQRDDPLRTVEVIAPGELAVSELRRDVARRLGGVFAIRFRSFPRWIDDLAADAIAAANGRRLGEAGLERLTARLLDESALGSSRGSPLVRARDQGGLSRALASSLGDLLQSGHDSESLADWRDAKDALRRDLARSLAAVEDTLANERLWDRHRAERTAAATVAAGPASDDPLLVFGFHDLTPAQRRLFAACDGRRPVVLLIPGTGPLDAPEAGESAVTSLLEWVEARGGSVEPRPRITPGTFGFEGGMFESMRLTDPGPRLELAPVATTTEEVAWIARRIRRELDAGRSPADFLVTTSTAGPSPRTFRRVFARAGIPLCDRAGLPAAATDSGRHALLLARGVTGARDNDRKALEFVLPAGSDDPTAAREAFLRARTAAERVTAFRELYVAYFGDEPSAAVGSALDDVARVHDMRPLSLARFTPALAAALAVTRDRDPPDPERVLLVARDAARFLRRPVVFHPGLVEGAWLRPAREDPLLPDWVRRERNEAGAHEGRELRVAEDRRDERILLARFALEAATAHTVLSFAYRERVGTEIRPPSVLLQDLARRREVPLDPTLPRSAEPETPFDELDLHQTVLARNPDPGDAELRRFASLPGGRHLPAALAAGDARFGPELTRWDGVLPEGRARKLVQERVADRRWSPSSLGRLANCPFGFLLDLLKLSPPQESENDFTHLERGSIYHDLLDATIRELRRRELVPLTRERLPAALDALDHEIEKQRAREIAPLPEVRRVGREATLAALRNDAAVLLAREAWRAPSERTTIVATETKFADEPHHPVRFPLPDGEELPLRGRVDRLDRDANDELVVIDYKTGMRRVKDHTFRGKRDDKQEVEFQAPIYLEVIRRTREERAARAVLYHATIGQGYEEVVFTAADLEAARAEIGELLAGARDHARRGWFPCTPGSRCCHSDLESACGPAVVARFLAKTDPELADWIARVRGDRPEPRT